MFEEITERVKKSTQDQYVSFRLDWVTKGYIQEILGVLEEKINALEDKIRYLQNR